MASRMAPLVCPRAARDVALAAIPWSRIHAGKVFIPGQYRGARGTKAFARPVELVHNIVLSRAAI